MYKKDFLKNSIILFTTSIMLLLIWGCDSSKSNPAGPVIHIRGEIENLNNMMVITPGILEQLLTDNDMTVPFTLTYSVETISVEYYTIDANGIQEIASGALIIPLDVNNLPLVSIQHGTESKSDLVASVSTFNSSEGIMGMIMASMGYFVVVPDYLGFGVSDMMHPYMHGESLIPSVIDLMRAGRTYCSDHEITLDGDVFLTGYSEGGFATLLTQKKIEAEYQTEFNLIAVAPMAGPYDLLGMSGTIFQSNTYNSQAYIGFFFTAYNDIYNWNRLTDFFNEPYAAQMTGLYDGSKTWGEIIASLPDTFAELMDPNFADDFNNGNEQDILTALQENTMLDWTPQAPIHFFHGDADQLVSIQHSITAMNRLTENGATDIQLTIIPGGTHESAGLPAVIGAIEWFEEY
ncbi:alpha/beta hydrolase family protein [Candidatus Cloacimonadota bacterium]